MGGLVGMLGMGGLVGMLGIRMENNGKTRYGNAKNLNLWDKCARKGKDNEDGKILIINMSQQFYCHSLSGIITIYQTRLLVRFAPIF